MKSDRNRTVVLYINEDEVTVLADGTVVSGVRAEVSDLPVDQAIANASPRKGEEVSNSHVVRQIARPRASKPVRQGGAAQ